jgi:hypothetical protein
MVDQWVGKMVVKWDRKMVALSAELKARKMVVELDD